MSVTSTEVHSVGPFILGKTLGEGATGKVKLGFHKDTGFKVAVKILKKEMLLSKPSLHKKVQREIAILKLIDHPNVLKLYDVFETSKYLFIIMEFVEGGELFEYLVARGSLDAHEALRFFQMIIHGVDYIHSQHVCHRDLKPENILLDSEKRLKLADLGMAAICKLGKLLSTSCGSPHYASPEVVMGKEYDGRLADVWSCGVILYALVSGKLPFDDENIRVLLRKVKEGQFAMPPFLHRDVRDLISRMLVVDPTKRITIAAIKQHPWFTSNHNPVLTAPCTTLDDSCEPVQRSAIDGDVVITLESLGMGTAREIEEQLMGSASSQARMFYRILVYQKEHPPSEVYERIVRSQGRARAASTSIDTDGVSPGCLTDRPVLPYAASSPASSSAASRGTPSPGGRERSCSVGGPKMPAVILPRMQFTGEAQQGPHVKSVAPPSPSPLRGVALPQVQGSESSSPSSSSPASVASASSLPGSSSMVSPSPPPPPSIDAPAASASSASSGGSDESPSGSQHVRRKKSISRQHALLMSPKGSPPTSPGQRRRAPSDASEELFPVGNPARRTFWSSIFKRSDKPLANAEKPHASDLGVHSTKALAEIQQELQRCFDALGVEWQPHESGYRAKYASIEGTMSCQFSANIARIKKTEVAGGQPSYFIEFKFDKGDCDLYNDMCSVIEKDVKL